MAFKSKNIVLISSVILVFLLGVTGVSHAVLSMSEIQYLFAQGKGKSWKNATPEERKDFIRDVQGREEFQEGPFKGKKEEIKKGPDIIDMSTVGKSRKMKAPYDVRSSFEAETGNEWNDATEEEQKLYWKTYKAEEKRLKKEERRHAKKQRTEEKKKEREYRQKKRKINREKKVRNREERLKRQELRRKRVAQKREAKKKKREWETFRQKMKESHKKSTKRKRK